MVKREKVVDDRGRRGGSGKLDAEEHFEQAGLYGSAQPRRDVEIRMAALHIPRRRQAS